MADDKYRGRTGYGRSDSIFSDDDRERNYRRQQSGSGEVGGFFQRAGEEVRSWLGGGDDRGSTNQSDGGTRSNYGDYESRESGSDWAGGNSGPSSQGNSSPFDDHYRGWRDRHIEQMDREYEEYCRHRQQQFETEFHGWRQKREGQIAGSSTMTSSGETGGSAMPSGGSTEASGGTASATESSTGSSATTGSVARAGSRKSQQAK